MVLQEMTTYLENVETLLQCGTIIWANEQPDLVTCSKNLYTLCDLNIDNKITIDTLKSLMKETERNECEDKIKKYILGRMELFESTFVITTSIGRQVRLQGKMQCKYNEHGLVSMFCVCTDITHNHTRDYSTRLNDEKFYRLFGDAPIGICLLRVDSSCFLSNDSFIESVHYKESELKEMPFYSLIDEEDQHAFMGLFQSVCENKIPSFRNEFRIVNKNGEKIWSDITLSTVKDMFDSIKYFIVMTQPCQRNKKAGPRKGLINTIREELNDLSLRDSLSGLYNRQYALKKLKELILIFYEKHLTFSALLIDVDHIRHINDTYGHGCGDKIIHDLSDVFKSLTRDTDLCARWGGEEFVILFPEMNIETAMLLAERLRLEVKNTIMMWEGKEIQVTVTVCVTVYSSDDTLKTFINKLDQSLYRDKGSSRDQVLLI